MEKTEFRDLGRKQSIMSAALLALVLVTCGLADTLARNRPLEIRTTAWSSALAAKNNTLFSYTGSFVDFEERVLLDEIPNADYSKPGTYFFGTSNMKWAFSTWDLPQSERERLGNYGIGASNHKDQLEFIRFLIERYGFLKAGDRDTVVLGVSFHLAIPAAPSGGYWAALLRRRGLYTLTGEGQIEPTAMDPIARWFRIEQARSSGFIWNMGRLLHSAAKAYLTQVRPVRHDPLQYQAVWRARMGERWQQNIDEAMKSLCQTIELVRARGANIKIVLLPQGSWMEGLPFGSRYDQEVRAICAEANIPVLDLSHSLPDDDFIDSNHLLVRGQEKFRKILMNELDQKGL